MKSNIRERNDSAEQWKGGISFHSIYYRYFSFIFALLILFFYVVGRRQGLETLDVDLSLVQLQLSPREFALYGNGILLLFSIPFYFYKKLKIGREGIYLPGIKLFVPWEVMSGFPRHASLKKEAAFFTTESPLSSTEKKRSRFVFITSRFFPSLP